MNWIVLVTVLALIQFIVFGALVAVARITYSVPAPTMTGPLQFECINRVHLNTLERLVIFLPLLWRAAQSWSAERIAGIGCIYLLGRTLHWCGYMRSPDARGMGNIMTRAALAALLVLTILGLVRRFVA